MFNNQRNIKKISFFIASVYAFAGFLWIIFSDMTVSHFVNDTNLLSTVQTYKGWVYVLVTAILLYLLTYNLFHKNTKAYDKYVKSLKNKQNEIEKNKQLIETIIEEIPDAIYVKDTNGKYIFLNSATAKLMGKEKQDVISGYDTDVFNEEDAKMITDIDKKILQSHQIKQNEETITPANSKKITVHTTKGPLRTSKGEVFGLFGITRDITKAKEYEKNLLQTNKQFFHLAHYDILTQLPNRLYLLEELDKRSSSEVNFALVLVDIDGFKVINDSYGHSYGDKLIIEVAKTIEAIFSKPCFVTRNGGDEFGIIIYSSDKDMIDGIIERLYAALSQPFEIDDIEVYITVSIGIAIKRKKTQDREIILQEADSAMGNAKNIGKNTYSYFNDAFTQRAMLHTTITTKLKNAITNKQLELYFQPQNDAKTQKIIGAEALIRWNDGVEFIPPATFIPIAEETGLIIDVGKFVIQSGFEFAKKVNQRKMLNGKIAINISAKEFNHIKFLQYIDYVTEKTKCDPKYIELEITESSILQNPQKTVNILKSLRNRGFSIAIDDFGTGYSSLSYLKTLPIDTLKIDQSFINNILNEPKNQTIVTTIIALAKGLNISVLAEGVETRQELEFLQMHKIDLIQGFLFSKPLNEENFEKSLLKAATDS